MTARPLGGGGVVEAVVAPGGEVVVVFAVGELGAKKRSPEVVIDATRMDVAQDVAKFA